MRDLEVELEPVAGHIGRTEARGRPQQRADRPAVQLQASIPPSRQCPKRPFHSIDSATRTRDSDAPMPV